MILRLASFPSPPEVRNSPEVRKRAERALQQMVAPDLMRAAVTADYSSECLEFLRSCFDIQDPDPSMVQTWVSKFKKRMTTLFIEGQILGDSSALPAEESEQATYVKTTSQMVFEEISFPEPRLGISFKGKTAGVKKGSKL